MSICFLGTSAGIPVQHRSTSATLLRLASMNFLFDAGEGVQRQFQFVKGGHKLQNITRIFITHLHGDHIFGLPGLLLGMQNVARQLNNNNNDEETYVSPSSSKKRRKKMKRNNFDSDNNEEDFVVVKIYGPPGLYHYIASSIILSCTTMQHLRVEVHELVGGRVKRVMSPSNNNKIRNPFYDDYPEYNMFGGELIRKEIPCQNGVWTIEDVSPPITREDVVNDPRGSRVSKYRLDRFRIQAAEVDHLPGISTFGYVVQEPEPVRNIDAEKAKALGVTPRDKKYELLKRGFSVFADDDLEREVHPHDVLKPQTKKSRKIAVVGDNRRWTSQMTEIAKNADILVHEATLSEEDYNVSVCLYLNFLTRI